MKVSRFQKWKKTLPQQIAYFSTEADKDIGDDEWEMPIHRHSAAEILVWILDKAGATLRKSQLVEAWFSIVRKYWNLMDIDQYNDRNHQLILYEIEYYVIKAQYKKNDEVEYLRYYIKTFGEGNQLLVSTSNGVKRIRRIAIA